MFAGVPLLRFGEMAGIMTGIFDASKTLPEKDPGGEAAMAEPTKEELMARIAELEKQTGSRKRGVIDFKVGEKGGVSVYGLGRFPVTLYYEQWIRLLDAAADLRAFLEENKSRLKLKDQQ
jgi:hypothetical protein